MSLFGDLNEVKILGNMTSDPELRFTGNGTPVASFSVATNRRFKQGEEWKDQSEFHNVVVWSNLAQQLAQRAKKGTRIMVLGRLQTRSWDGQDGQKKYRTEIVADDVFLIDRYEKGKSGDLPMPQATNGQGGSFNGGSANSGKSGSAAAGSASSASSAASGQVDEIDPDDLPF